MDKMDEMDEMDEMDGVNDGWYLFHTQKNIQFLF
jgi:hypothetical protein